MSRLETMVQALVSAPMDELPDATLRKAGFGPDEIAELCARPDAAKAMLAGAMTAHLVPALPAVLRNVARRAQSGDKAAEATVLGLMGDDSPLREQLGVTLTHATPEALHEMTLQTIERLGAYARERTAP